MKQENKKIGEELQAGLDHVSAFQLESESTLRKLNDEFGISGDQPQSRHSMNRPQVPLRVFIFGTKPKKHRHSIFSCIRRNRKFQALRGEYHTGNESHRMSKNITTITDEIGIRATSGNDP
ncbi:Protein NETWORKED 2D [Abeliophyllum distichum]|uniref:Protein NETWORKED 2D n=1 Tax=Abeliophyllum distichum TaxID=126358 RepID=A0ABD1V3R9_9LAMI